jgi:hypothetical protein
MSIRARRQRGKKPEVNMELLLSTLAGALGKWPTVGLLIGLFAVPFVALIAVFAHSLRIGPIAIELRMAARDLGKLSIAMAESRIAELQVTVRQVLSPLSESDRVELRAQIAKLEAVVARLPRLRA